MSQRKLGFLCGPWFAGSPTQREQRERVPPLRARGSLQCLIASRVGEDFFVSLVELGSGGANIVHRECSTSLCRSRQSTAMMNEDEVAATATFDHAVLGMHSLILRHQPARADIAAGDWLTRIQAATAERNDPFPMQA